MKTKRTDVVAEYLHEVDQRLAGLPVLQRRELLADLEAHIATERAERNLTSEGELIDVLERLGTPEAVAAAAHEEAGVRPAPAPPKSAWVRAPWVLVAVVTGILFVLVACAGMMTMSRDSGSVEPAQVVPAVPAPAPSVQTQTP